MHFFLEVDSLSFLCFVPIHSLEKIPFFTTLTCIETATAPISVQSISSQIMEISVSMARQRVSKDVRTNWPIEWCTTVLLVLKTVHSELKIESFPHFRRYRCHSSQCFSFHNGVCVCVCVWELYYLVFLIFSSPGQWTTVGSPRSGKSAFVYGFSFPLFAAAWVSGIFTTITIPDFDVVLPTLSQVLCTLESNGSHRLLFARRVAG